MNTNMYNAILHYLFIYIYVSSIHGFTHTDDVRQIILSTNADLMKWVLYNCTFYRSNITL